MKRLIDYDWETGAYLWHEYDADTDTMRLTTEQDVSQILEENKAAYNSGDGGWLSSDREMKRYARIPNSIILKWRVEEGIDVYNRDHWKKVKQKLNSNEWRHLRTAPGTE